MKAFNVVGESPASSPKEVYVGEAGEQAEGQKQTFSLLSACIVWSPLNLCVVLPLVPTRGPQDVKIKPLTATQLEVAWNPPPSEAQNGKIQGYKVNINSMSSVKNVFLLLMDNCVLNNPFYTFGSIPFGPLYILLLLLQMILQTHQACSLV